MSLIDMIEQGAGSGARQQIGARVGLSPQRLESVIGSLAPTLGPKLAQHAVASGLDTVPTGEAAPAPGSDEADALGRTIHGSILGSKDANRAAAADASNATGIGVDKIKAVLPQLALIAAVALAAHQLGAGGGLGGMLGGLLGGLGRA